MPKHYRLTAEGGWYKTTGGNAHLDARYSFTAQFMFGAAFQARSARAIERCEPRKVTALDKMKHRAHVVAAVQAAASLESEAWEFAYHRLGAAPAASIDRKKTLERFQAILQQLGKPPLSRGTQPWQRAAVVIELRNECVH
jgi:hypothetical protein